MARTTPRVAVLFLGLCARPCAAALFGYAWYTWLLGLVALLFGLNLAERIFSPQPPDIVGTKRKVSVDEVAGLPSNPRVFFDIDIDGKRVGRVEMELFSTVCPKTCESFRCLCTGEKGIGLGKVPLWYKYNTFHRILPDFMCQAGDIIHLNGTAGESIYGAPAPPAPRARARVEPPPVAQASSSTTSSTRAT